MNKVLSIICVLVSVSGYTQFTIFGTVSDSNDGSPIPFCSIKVVESNQSFISNEYGTFKSKSLPAGNYQLIFSNSIYNSDTINYTITDADLEVKIKLVAKYQEIDVHNVYAIKESVGPIGRIKPIDGVTIAAGKKAELINLKEVNANLALNNARQIYSRIPGLNIWESDGAGIQLGIGGRGLNPSRTSNYNTRQNGYEISADALGYPESYYSPPSQAIEEIQFIKGAGSLQFGPQFGGMINFKLKEGKSSRNISGTYDKTFGSFNVQSSYLDFGGRSKRWRYFFFMNRKTGNEWRPNSNYELTTGGFNMSYYFSELSKIKIEFTKMAYLAKQPGGLTDFEFSNTPFISKRDRNWFEVDWNLWAVDFEHHFNSSLILKSNLFGLVASRKALGYLGQINRVDPLSERNLISGYYNNIGNETRLLKTYEIGNHMQAALIGFRIYNGFSISQQGYGNADNTPDFYYIDQSDFEYSRFEFPSQNIAVFTEHIFNLSDKLSIVPGIRFEYISTIANGRFNAITYDLANNIIANDSYTDARSNQRNFIIGGLGINYELKSDSCQVYFNFSQNYRSINFTDMQIVNPNLRIDPGLQDETGFNSDFGVKGIIRDALYYDLSIYGLFYNNRIGTTIQTDSVLFNTYQYRTNISQSLTIGFEGIVQVNWLKLFRTKKGDWGLGTYLNYSYSYSRYLDKKSTFYGNLVEFVPPVNYKTGIDLKYKKLSLSYQFSWVHWQYSDASNSLSQPNAVNGIIPTYQITDVTLKYSYDMLDFSLTVNNLSNEVYFTRRATGYPGPGIITAAPRSIYFTFGINF